MNPAPVRSPVRSFAEENIVLAKRFDQWLEIQNYSLCTRKAYGGLMRDFCRFLHSRNVIDLNPFDIREYLGYLQKKGLSSKSLDRQFHVLRSFYEFLLLGGKVTSNPVRRMSTRQRVGRKLPHFPTIEEVEKLIGSTESLRDRAIIEIFYGTGCRISEIASIRCEDVEFNDCSIRVLGKGDKQRIVLFGRMASEALHAYLGDRRKGFLFQNWDGCQKLRVSRAKPNKHEPSFWWRGCWREYPNGTIPAVERWKWLGRVSEMTYEQARGKLLEIAANVERPKADVPLATRTLLRIVKGAAHRAGLKGITARSLRHAFATHMLVRSGNLRAVQELLGHDHVATTAIYTHLAIQNLQDIHRRFHPSAQEEPCQEKRK